MRSNERMLPADGSAASPPASPLAPGPTQMEADEPMSRLKVRTQEAGPNSERRIVLEFRLGPQARDEMIDALVGDIYRRLADFLTTQYA